VTSRWGLKVGIALGGGAARGLAHIGVLRAFLREGIPIDIVVGTSMGAIIGGAYAATGDIVEVERRVRKALAGEEFQRTRLNFLRETRTQRGGLLYSVANLVKRGVVYGVSTMRPSFLSAEEFAASMRETLPDKNIEDLPVRFAAIALDLEGGREVVICHGNSSRRAIASAVELAARGVDEQVVGKTAEALRAAGVLRGSESPVPSGDQGGGSSVAAGTFDARP